MIITIIFYRKRDLKRWKYEHLSLNLIWIQYFCFKKIWNIFGMGAKYYPLMYTNAQCIKTAKCNNKISRNWIELLKWSLQFCEHVSLDIALKEDTNVNIAFLLIIFWSYLSTTCHICFVQNPLNFCLQNG